jgi:modulator of FtsH protease
MSESVTYPGAGAQDRDQAHTLFVQTMGYLAATAALFALGAWLGRSLAGGAGIIAFIAASPQGATHGAPRHHDHPRS